MRVLTPWWLAEWSWASPPIWWAHSHFRDGLTTLGEAAIASLVRAERDDLPSFAVFYRYGSSISFEYAPNL